jgi:hypothetical protein
MFGPNLDALNSESHKLIDEAATSKLGFLRLGNRTLSTEQMNKEMALIHTRTQALAQILWEITELMKKHNLR